MNGQSKSSDGWVAPKTDAEVSAQFFAKHGDDHYTRQIDRRWRRIGRMVETNARVPDGQYSV